MKPYTILLLSALALFTLSGCSATFSERKAPCPPTASLGSGPCKLIPINIAQIVEKKDLRA